MIEKPARFRKMFARLMRVKLPLRKKCRAMIGCAVFPSHTMKPAAAMAVTPVSSTSGQPRSQQQCERAQRDAKPEDGRPAEILHELAGEDRPGRATGAEQHRIQ